MATFELGQFVEGSVRADGWWTPRPGQRVYLSAAAPGVLSISRHSGYMMSIVYRWPRNASTSQAACILAVKHYERCTGRDAFGGSDARSYYSPADMGYSDSGEPISR